MRSRILKKNKLALVYKIGYANLMALIPMLLFFGCTDSESDDNPLVIEEFPWSNPAIELFFERGYQIDSSATSFLRLFKNNELVRFHGLEFNADVNLEFSHDRSKSYVHLHTDSLLFQKLSYCFYDFPLTLKSGAKLYNLDYIGLRITTKKRKFTISEYDKYQPSKANSEKLLRWNEKLLNENKMEEFLARSRKKKTRIDSL
jgi:hypothetical protein